MLRIAAAGFTPFILMACLLALGSFDTVEAQNLTVGSTTLAFNVAQGGSPSVQTVTTGSTGGSINFSISYTASWITAGIGAGGVALWVQGATSSRAAIFERDRPSRVQSGGGGANSTAWPSTSGPPPFTRFLMQSDTLVWAPLRATCSTVPSRDAKTAYRCSAASSIQSSIVTRT